MGVAFGETLFVGDAFFTPALLEKHRIPFYADIQAALATLSALKEQVTSFKYIVAGHGEVYTSAQQSQQAIQATADRLETILQQIREALASGEAYPTASIFQAVTYAQGAQVQALSQYVLYQTTIQAGLSALYARGEIAPVFRENALLWQRV